MTVKEKRMTEWVAKKQEIAKAETIADQFYLDTEQIFLTKNGYSNIRSISDLDSPTEQNNLYSLFEDTDGYNRWEEMQVNLKKMKDDLEEYLIKWAFYTLEIPIDQQTIIRNNAIKRITFLATWINFHNESC